MIARKTAGAIRDQVRSRWRRGRVSEGGDRNPTGWVRDRGLDDRAPVPTQKVATRRAWEKTKFNSGDSLTKFTFIY